MHNSTPNHECKHSYLGFTIKPQCPNQRVACDHCVQLTSTYLTANTARRPKTIPTTILVTATGPDTAPSLSLKEPAPAPIKQYNIVPGKIANRANV